METNFPKYYVFWINVLIVKDLCEGHEGGGNTYHHCQDHPVEASQEPHVDRALDMETISILDDDVSKVIFKRNIIFILLEN